MAVNKQTQIVPNVRIARGIVQSVRFVASEKSVVARSKGYPRIVVKPTDTGYIARSVYSDPKGKKFVLSVEAKTPKKVFAAGVRNFWN